MAEPAASIVLIAKMAARFGEKFATEDDTWMKHTMALVAEFIDEPLPDPLKVTKLFTKKAAVAAIA